MKLIVWFLARYAGTVPLVILEQAITDELALRARCAAHGQQSPHQNDPGDDLITLAFFIIITSFVVFICRSHFR